MNMKVKVALTISRPTFHDDRKIISLRLHDRTSGIEFVDVDFPTADFMEALTGVARVDGAGEVRGLENVGKVREVESTHFLVLKDVWGKVMEGDHFSRNDRGNNYLREQFAREGWHVSSRLGSQNAEITVGNTVKILGSYYRYVDKGA